MGHGLARPSRPLWSRFLAKSPNHVKTRVSIRTFALTPRQLYTDRSFAVLAMVPFGTYDVHHGCTRTRSLLIYLFPRGLSFKRAISRRLEYPLEVTFVNEPHRDRISESAWITIRAGKLGPQRRLRNDVAVNSNTDFLTGHAAQIASRACVGRLELETSAG